MSSEGLFTALAIITASLFLVIYFFGGERRKAKR